MKKPIKRILGLFFGIAFLLSIAFPALAAYTHFESGVVTETGFYVGAYGTETEVIDADGNFTIVNAEITTADIETLSLGGTVITSTAADINTLTGVASQFISQFIVYQVEDLAADGDISARPLFVCPEGFKFTISSINIIAQGSASGIDDSNTCVIAALNGTDSIVSKTYDTDPAFPADGVADSLGALSGTYKILAAGDILKFSITNGSTADTPAMILQVVGELATVSE